MNATTTKNVARQRSLDAAIYRKAAHIVETSPGSKFSCCAVDEAATGRSAGDWSSHTRRYREMFAEEDQGGYMTIRQFLENGVGVHPNDLRSLALCFMAAMVEAGDA